MHRQDGFAFFVIWATATLAAQSFNRRSVNLGASGNCLARRVRMVFGHSKMMPSTVIQTTTPSNATAQINRALNAEASVAMPLTSHAAAPMPAGQRGFDQPPSAPQRRPHRGKGIGRRHALEDRCCLGCRLPGGTNADGALDRILAVDCNQPRQ